MKKIILMGFPNHRNLGDQAIALAEEIFIRKNFPEYDFYSVPEGIMLKCVDKVRKACKDEDILVLHGGGNFGNQYMYIEESRRRILELFPNNPIILMPQSIYFSNDEELLYKFGYFRHLQILAPYLQAGLQVLFEHLHQ